MSEDGEKDKEKEQKSSSSRPSGAAARRERRDAARAGTGSDAKAGKSAPKGKAGSGPDGKTSGKDRSTTKRGGTATVDKRSLFGRMVLFLREVWGELGKVIWPTRKQMVTYTAVVLVFVAFMIALVYLLDFVFLQGVDFVFGD
ncbi:preprotein translocase subunit SecE [Saccharomonospora sp. CUA-673]|uniref:preprotein translocase subunit SecE n=1 Tax=Saccharomonospora sp. CUA-673 TaxID=1904969 RepID=UPI00095A427E|nr:preprotein translocase subunit SecE [Saccharomonospora sp. CUA-673]OLT42585.1 preprotein translocase subunit SecE [Saccharomonospora sp. CUA-673]